LNLDSARSLLENRPYSVKFSYFIAKNKVLIRDEIIALDKSRHSSPEYLEYDKKRLELARKYADKDQDGKAIIKDNQFVLTEKIDEFQTELEELKKIYFMAIEEQENKVKDFEELIERETDFIGLKINLNDIPDGIEPSILEVLITSNLIDD